MPNTTTSPTPAAPQGLRPSPTPLDLALTLLGTALAVFLAYLSYTDGPTNPASDGGPFEVSVWAVPTMAIVTLPMLWRTSAPLVALGGLGAAVLVHAAAFGELVHCGSLYPVIAILGYAAARRLSGRDRVLGFGLTVFAVFVTAITEVIGFETITLGLPLALIGFGLGAAVAGRRPLAPIREELATA